MLDFPLELADWRPLFTTLAEVGATMAGLLFVALSLHANSLRDDGNANLRRLAQHTFADFVQMLFIGVFFAVPAESPNFLGIGTVLIFVLSLRNLAGTFLQALRDHDHRLHREYFFRRLGLSLLGRGLLVAGGVGLLLQHADHEQVWQDLLWIFSGSAVLLLSAMRNAWFLLTHEIG